MSKRSYDYSILINTCDKYSDAWDPFFRILKIAWGTELPSIYLNTETKKYIDEDVNVTSLTASHSDIKWGERLIESLQQIPDDYILMMLEDFYFEEPIDVDLIDKALDLLKSNNNILCVQLVPQGECCRSSNCINFVRRKKYGEFRIVAGPTMWRKEYLKMVTLKNDTPWEWEYFGTFRTWLWGKLVYCWCNSTHHIFKYDVEHGGAIHRGKWVGYKVRELDIKYKLNIDYGDREIEEDWMRLPQYKEKIPRYRRINSIIHNRTKEIVNIILGFLLRIRAGRYTS